MTSSWTYDKRGRVQTEFADASGYRSYTYLPTGETIQVLQNPALGVTSTIDPKSVGSVQKIGSLGRVMERDDFRNETAADCASSPHEDSTNFQYDTPWNLDAARYGVTAGKLTAVMTGTTTVAIGYNNLGLPVVRDEWIGGSTDRHSIVDSRGADGRLLSRAMTSSYLAGYNSLSTFGYAVGYDFAGEPVQINPTYNSAGVFQPITAATAPSAYWLAGAGPAGVDPAALSPA
jgi:hypothetical protein